MNKATDNIRRIDRLRADSTLPREDLRFLLTTMTQEEAEYLYKNAREVREQHYGKDVYLSLPIIAEMTASTAGSDAPTVMSSVTV